MDFVPAAEADKGTIEDFGVALLPNDGELQHCGLVYWDADENLCIVHLRDHLDMKKERLQEKYFCARAGCIKNKERRTAIHAKLIAMKDRQLVHYGFRFEPESFDQELRVKKFAPGWGLTCASFVVAILHSVGVKVADLATWDPKRLGDEEWQNKFIGHLKSRYGEAYASSVEKFVPSIRVRPGEAGACVASADVPLSCRTAEKLAVAILEAINALALSPKGPSGRLGDR
jgi:hypothetical protein